MESVSYIGDQLFFLKALIGSNIADPLNPRPASSKFIMTSYPQRETNYPIITLKDMNSYTPQQLGLQSEAYPLYTNMEIRVWGRNVAERDQLSGSVFNLLRSSQIGSPNTFQSNDLHDLKLLSSTNIDENNGPKSKVMTWQTLYIAQ